MGNSVKVVLAGIVIMGLYIGLSQIHPTRLGQGAKSSSSKSDCATSGGG